MYAPDRDRLAACLEGLERHLERLRELDLSCPAECDRALMESRTLLGTIAMYRGLVQRMERMAGWCQAA